MIGSIETTGHAYPYAKPSPVDEAAEQALKTLEQEATEATYMPQRISYDADVSVLITEYRNVSTGEVRKQVPEPAMLETYRSRAALGLDPYGREEPPGVSLAAEKGQKDAAPQDAAPLEPAADTGLGLGGFGGPAVSGPAPMGSTGTGMAAPERPVGGQPQNAFRTVA